jgi:hypothetical protein
MRVNDECFLLHDLMLHHLFTQLDYLLQQGIDLPLEGLKALFVLLLLLLRVLDWLQIGNVRHRHAEHLVDVQTLEIRMSLQFRIGKLLGHPRTQPFLRFFHQELLDEIDGLLSNDFQLN